MDALEFGSVMPGGYSSASFSLQRDLGDVPPELYPFVRVTVLDERDGRVLNAGRLQVPGRGSPWKLTTAGARAVAGDVKRPWVWVDSRAGEWQRADEVIAGPVDIDNAQVSSIGGGGASGTYGIRKTWPRGLVIPANGVTMVRYPHLPYTGQTVGRVDVTHQEGLTAAGTAEQIRVFELFGTSAVADSDTWSTSTGTMSAVLGGGSIASNHEYADLRSLNTPGGTVGNDVTWTQATLLRIQAARRNAAGTLLTSAGDYPTAYLVAHQVVNDLLGSGFLPSCDGSTAQVSTFSTPQITQLAYTDGVTPAEVLDDLMALDPAMRWAAWEPNDAGLYRFVWDTWPTAVAWELDAPPGGLTAAGADPDLFDTVRVRWEDDRGRTRWTTATQTVPLLAAAGLSRRTTLDLGSDVGSVDQAAAAAAAFLAGHAQPLNTGTLTISTPVFDRILGRMLQPWELTAGVLIRVRNLAPRLDSLNATDRDGSSVFRATEVRYSQRTNAATVTLDSYSDSLFKALNRLARFTAKVARRR